MAFPDTPLGTTVELGIGGVWTDITRDVHLPDRVVIRSAQAGTVSPGSCTLTLNNLDGRYSPRNPLSPYYGVIGRNTPLRVSIKAGPAYLAQDGSPSGVASTPAVPAVQITGSLDLRAEVDVDWHGPASQILLSRWEVTGDQRSYMLRIVGDLLVFNWSTDGTESGAGTIYDTLPAAIRGRAAVRATLDVPGDGAGHSIVTLYWAPSMAGPWTVIGIPHILAGTASVHAGTAPLATGAHDATGLPLSPERFPFTGKGYRFEVRNGIGGQVVASPDFTALAPGTSTFTDGVGRTWVLAGTAAITNRQTRFSGEVSSWPPVWGVSGQDVRTPIEAAGILRRLGQGTSPLDSTLRRRIPPASPLGYWPMEDGRSATQAASPIPGVAPMTSDGLTFAADDSGGNIMPGSGPLPALGTASSIGARVPPASGTGWHVEMVYRLDALPATQQRMLRVTVAGSATVAYVQVLVGGGSVRIEARDRDGDVVTFFAHSDPTALGDFVGAWNRLQIFTIPDGADTHLVAAWRSVITGIWWYARTHYTGTPGHVTTLTGTWGADFEGMRLGHLGVWPTAGHFEGATPVPGVLVYEGCDDGFLGEAPSARIIRLCAEEGIPLTVAGSDVPEQHLGSQRPAAILALLGEAAAAGGGILVEQRDTIGLSYRTIGTLYHQPVRLALDYATGQVAPPLRPVDDDRGIRNDVRVQRRDGSEGRSVLEAGPLSVQDPPDGVGRYDTQVTLNLYSDAQTRQVAGWLRHLGTWDAARYPTVRVALHSHPELIGAVTDLEVGDRITIANPPPWLPPDTIDLLAQGWAETLGVYTWGVEYTCAPGGPWDTAQAGIAKAAPDGTVLAAAATATATTLSIRTTAGPLWSTNPADYPVDIVISGERVTVTAVSGVSSPQTATVIRGANGITKPLPAGAAVTLAVRPIPSL